jgi:hypothetical protein
METEEKRKLMMIVLKIDDAINSYFDKDKIVVDELTELIRVRGVLMDRIYKIQQKINFISFWQQD